MHTPSITVLNIQANRSFTNRTVLFPLELLLSLESYHRGSSIHLHPQSYPTTRPHRCVEKRLVHHVPSTIQIGPPSRSSYTIASRDSHSHRRVSHTVTGAAEPQVSRVLVASSMATS